jgi:Tol biopolymer transport system component
MMKSMTDDLTGKPLGPYQIVAPLGKGGMGIVYKAYQPNLTRYVALKVLPQRYTDDPTFVGRFWQEARAAAKLEHPHILPIYDYGEYEGYHYIAMQLVRDGSLAQLLHGNPLLLEQIGYIIAQVSGALDYAHSREVIHRDVKPDNILISRQSGCMLTDFGIAKLLESTAHLTEIGTSVGTPTYMSPEQIRGDEDVDGRSDIYSLGIVLYEMATGRPPFEGPNSQAIQWKHLNEPPRPPRSLNSILPERVAAVILKALAKNRAERYATVGAMAQDLQAALPMGLLAGEGGGAAILGAASEGVVIEDQAAQISQPISEAELTAVLKASSVVVPNEGQQAERPGPEAAEPPVEAQGRARTTESRRPVTYFLRKVPVIVWPVALLVVAAIVVGAIGLRSVVVDIPTPPTSLPTSTAAVSLAQADTPTAVSTLTPQPTPFISQPTVTNTPEPTSAPSVTPTSEPALTATASPTSAPSPTASPTQLPTDTPKAMQPPAADLSGRLAIPLMYGNEPKVYIVSTNGAVEGIVGAARQPDYSPDGKKLIVNGEGSTWDKLRILDPIGGAPFEIGDPALAGHAHPAWSPGGDKIIYDDATIDPAGCRIFIRGLNTNGPGTGPGTLLSAGVGRGELIGRNPLWTTQDRFIFRGCNTWEVGQESDCGIWVMQGNGGTPHKLTANPGHIPIDVRANTVVYVSAEKGDWSIYTLDIVSGAIRQITEDGMNDGLAAISPDGRSVAFLSDRDGRLAVWSVGIQGGPARKFFDLSAEWGQLRADGWAEERLAWGHE